MNDELSDIPTYDQRVIRVFVSSTFRDMQAQRDELIKQTFPRLRKLCDERNVVWSEVGLRRGNAKLGQTLLSFHIRNFPSHPENMRKMIRKTVKHYASKLKERDLFGTVFYGNKKASAHVA